MNCFLLPSEFKSVLLSHSIKKRKGKELERILNRLRIIRFYPDEVTRLMNLLKDAKRVYTPGKSGSAHPTPHETIPTAV